MPLAPHPGAVLAGPGGFLARTDAVLQCFFIDLACPGCAGCVRCAGCADPGMLRLSPRLVDPRFRVLMFSMNIIVLSITDVPMPSKARVAE